MINKITHNVTIKKAELTRFYTQREAAAKLRTSPRMLIYWEKHLSSRPFRKKGHHRVYTEEDLQQFRLLFLLLDQGWDSSEVKKKLRLMKLKKVSSLEGLYWDISKKQWITYNEIIGSYMKKLLEESLASENSEQVLLDRFFSWIEKS